MKVKIMTSANEEGFPVYSLRVKGGYGREVLPKAYRSGEHFTIENNTIRFWSTTDPLTGRTTRGPKATMIDATTLLSQKQLECVLCLMKICGARLCNIKSIIGLGLTKTVEI